MLHAGGFTSLALALLDGIIRLDSECLIDTKPSNITIQDPNGKKCPEGFISTAQYCKCCEANMNNIREKIEKARDSCIRFANTEILSELDYAVKLVWELHEVPEKIYFNVRFCRAKRDSCFLLYESKKHRYENYTETYLEILAVEAMARNTQSTIYYKMPIILGIILVFGVGGNVALLYAFYKRSDIRSGRKMVLINVAVSDLLLLLFSFLGNYYFRLVPFTFGETACRLYNFFIITPPLVNILSIMLVSMERYYRPVRLCPGMSIAFVWSAASLQALKPAQESVITKFSFSNKTHCDVHTSVTTTIVVIIIGCFLPLAIIIFFTVATFRRLRREAPSESETNVRQERVVVLLPALAVLSTITYPSFYICWLIAAINKYEFSSLIAWFTDVTHLMINVNSALIPFTVYLSSEKFREQFDILLDCGGKNRQEETPNKARKDPPQFWE